MRDNDEDDEFECFEYDDDDDEAARDDDKDDKFDYFECEDNDDGEEFDGDDDGDDCKAICSLAILFFGQSTEPTRKPTRNQTVSISTNH